MKIITFLFLISTGCFAQTIAVEQFATGLTSPVAIAHAGDARLFVVERGGSIKIIDADGTVNTANFLTLSSSVISTGGERGLLGLAFHPDYAENGYFYVNYTRAGDGATVVARYQVSDDPDVADASSGTPVITVLQPFSNHNGGTIKFGPDGYLYIGMGDGGSGGDPGNRAQDINENLGKMLRIDVDSASPYVSPADNPFVGEPGNDEIWATGLRNPWKFSFDRVTGDLWVADVGQNAIEEINKAAPDAAGLNYGWRCYEGSVVYTGCSGDATFTFPIAEYTHSSTGGCSITGGYVYRGAAYPDFYGKYFFADYCVSRVGMFTEGSGITYSGMLSGVSSITSFGEDVNGELYLVSFSNGRIYKIIDPTMGTSDFASNGFSIYPNPADDFFSLSSTRSPIAGFAIHDFTGKCVMSRTVSPTNNLTVDVSALAQGIYSLTATEAGGKSFTTKVSVR